MSHLSGVQTLGFYLLQSEGEMLITSQVLRVVASFKWLQLIFNFIGIQANNLMRFASNNNQMRKKIEDYSYGLTDLIGKGFSSSVFRGINDKTKEKVAIKVIDLRSMRERPSAKKMLEGEVQALKKLNHINIMKCHDIYSTVNNCYIITEFCNEGDLENLLKKREKLPESEAIPIFRDIVNGYRAISDNKFLHRDLKPANILLKDKVAKIGDFGFAKRISSNPKQSVNVGSPLYMSPEALQSNIYTVKNDIWSLGVILYQILHGKAPWQSSTEKQLLQKISKQVYSINRQLSEDLKDFIQKALACDQSKRLGVYELFNHPFIVRITQEDGIPQLLRKQTSMNEVPSNNNIGLEQNLENITTEPTSIHHRQNPNQAHRSEKQVNSQMNFMRFIYRYLEMFPSAEECGRYTLGLKFIATKQMLSQLHSLKECLAHRQNSFNFEGWDEYIRNQEVVARYKNVLDEYSKKYKQQASDLENWVKIVKQDKRISCIVDTNLTRSEALSLIAISYSLQECKNLWGKLEKVKEQSWARVAQMLDFTMTYYQLNCFLVDNFHDPDYFSRNSKIDDIVEHKPVKLKPSNLPDLQNKLHALEIIK